MKEKPILFSGQMVRAILDGRKTQTRQVMKPPPPMGTSYVTTEEDKGKALCISHAENGEFPPYVDPWRHQPISIGDRLWVQETWSTESDEYDGWPPRDIPWRAEYLYRADDPQGYRDPIPWRPSIFMPRWVSRIDLDMVDIRAERLHDLSVDDAIAEGFTEETAPDFIKAWDSLHKKKGHGWSTNPWVWVIGFKRAAP